jgi:hypothetical protein
MQFHIFIIELQYQYLNYITGIPVLYKILIKIHNTGNFFYTSDRQVQEIPISIILAPAAANQWQWPSIPPVTIFGHVAHSFLTLIPLNL